MISHPSPPWSALNLIIGRHRRGVAVKLELRQRWLILCLVTGNWEKWNVLHFSKHCNAQLHSLEPVPSQSWMLNIPRKVSLVQHFSFAIPAAVAQQLERYDFTGATEAAINNTFYQTLIQMWLTDCHACTLIMPQGTCSKTYIYICMGKKCFS